MVFLQSHSIAGSGRREGLKESWIELELDFADENQ